MSTGCRVYWGSHGCSLERGHLNQAMHQCGVDGPVWRCDGCGVERPDVTGDDPALSLPACPDCGDTDLPYDSTDGDGICSKVERELDEVTQAEVWVWRFREEDPVGWSRPYPAGVFGEDVPEQYRTTQVEDDALRASWQAAGKTAVWDPVSNAWVYRREPATG